MNNTTSIAASGCCIIICNVSSGRLAANTASGVEKSSKKATKSLSMPRRKAAGCPVCLDALQANQTLVQLANCKHRFHEQCWLKWCEKQLVASCPLCRRPQHNSFAQVMIETAPDTEKQMLATMGALMRNQSSGSQRFWVMLFADIVAVVVIAAMICYSAWQSNLQERRLIAHVSAGCDKEALSSHAVLTSLSHHHTPMSRAAAKRIVSMAAEAQSLSRDDFIPIDDFRDDLIDELMTEAVHTWTPEQLVRWFDNHDVWAQDSIGRTQFVGMLYTRGVVASQ